MVVDDRARGARNTHSKYSSEDFSDSAGALGRIASVVYGVLLFMNAGPSGLGWCVCGTGECACVGYEFCHLTVDLNLPFDA